MKFITKRRLLTASLVIGVGVYLFALLLGTDWCEGNLVCSKYFYWGTYTDSIVLTISGFVFATLPITLITYPFSDRIFEAWKRFAVYAVPMVLIGYYYIEESGIGRGWLDFTIVYLMMLYGTFFLISLIIIAVAAWRGRSK